jgi:hypothetical protein
VGDDLGNAQMANVGGGGGGGAPAAGGSGSTIAANRATGEAWEKVAQQDMEATNDGVVSQLTIRVGSGDKTRLDLAGRSKATGAIALADAKASATAPLTPKQKICIPQIEQSGGVVVGKGKPGFPGGTIIPPTKVEIKRP